jgi:predicted phosphoribosyltransferase
VAAPDSLATLRHEADEVICPLVPAGFVAVGAYYRDFPQTTDDEVVSLLNVNS